MSIIATAHYSLLTLELYLSCDLRLNLKSTGGQSNLMFSEETMVKTAKNIHDHKFAELTGNDIFKGNAPPGSVEKPLSIAKLREMSGSDFFLDRKAASRDYLGAVHKWNPLLYLSKYYQKQLFISNTVMENVKRNKLRYSLLFVFLYYFH